MVAGNISAVLSSSSICRSVNIGRSSLWKAASIWSWPSLVLPIWVKVPRPNSAALRMKRLFGAEPIPIVNSRLCPRCILMATNSTSSLPTCPSVRQVWSR